MQSLCVLGRGHRVAAGPPSVHAPEPLPTLSWLKVMAHPRGCKDNGPHGCSWLTSVFSVTGITVFLQGMALEHHTDLASSLFFPVFFFFIGVSLLYHAVLVSAAQRCESAMCMHKSPPS
ncbi:unnamed protein product [Rangifer tarandus platyrhynchus]|uniref:Uncharacterized protein n=1 Tax=Rangifer tarandus platyrhynchus TaxID=3082113 RepID=A0AC59ZTI5_RANTA